MPKATTCILNGRSLKIADALILRQRNPKSHSGVANVVNLYALTKRAQLAKRRTLNTSARINVAS
jgi:hypothetical protein